VTCSRRSPDAPLAGPMPAKRAARRVRAASASTRIGHRRALPKRPRLASFTRRPRPVTIPLFADTLGVKRHVDPARADLVTYLANLIASPDLTVAPFGCANAPVGRGYLTFVRPPAANMALHPSTQKRGSMAATQDKGSMAQAAIQVEVANKLPIPIYVFSATRATDDWVDIPSPVDAKVGSAAESEPGPSAENVLKPDTSRKFEFPPDATVRAKSFLSGGHISDKQIPKAATTIDFSGADLTAPNAIGRFPEPNEKDGILLPVDSARRLVGVGKWRLPNNSLALIAREQCWRRCADSYVLAPEEERSMGVTSLTGIEKTSSTESTLTTTLGASVSGGFAFLSASLSASLTASSRTSQQITVTEQQTQFDTVNLANRTDKIATWLRWRLVDIILLVQPPSYVVKATLEASQAPFLLGGPYHLNSALGTAEQDVV
jgi:hypothetical protein